MSVRSPRGRVPALRVHPANAAPPRPEGEYVLYWMTACRRAGWNFGLQRAIEWCAEYQKPLLILEALRSGYPWASDRLHLFVLEGMRRQVQSFGRQPGLLYYPYVEDSPGAGRGLLEALASRACLVVADLFPAFFYPRMYRAAASRLSVPLELVDSNGLLPLQAADRVFTTAFSFRAFLQKNLLPHLYDLPDPDPLAGLNSARPPLLPQSLLRRWPAADASLAGDLGKLVSRLPIDHSVGRGLQPGGDLEARRSLLRFVRHRLPRYQEARNQPEEEAASGLSPYLHFGHISSHEVFHEVMAHAGWSVRDLSAVTGGRRSGWWGVDESTEAFLDQLVTWRELGFNLCSRSEDYDRYESLPAWAQATLTEHRDDLRDPYYSPEQFEQARTHDRLWNAAQNQLVREGRMHNYLRMLWGKKILEWSPTPEAALQTMIHLNNRYALDGRDPNSYSGIFWVLGRYDRPWGPERPVFGKIRYMSSENTARKLRVDAYIGKYS